ncbi:LOW QUALITY PROTEIN: cation/calcium exchanger 2-like [Pyrus x bretschneideri]|uniref:LOW QUALITY PROTEIN: cation/calcium exchanger 2-like n=1 Tax=Pyrus x bretschneideri TaxID=225117 RepID=UPI00202E5725|nr:LOW QUALITY PROTEIN: cation/calcium exchanger 2-like [Pyrus x bretschneideri]
MGTLVFLPKYKNYIIFLNISFLLVGCAFLIVHFEASDFPVLSTSEISASGISRFSGSLDCKGFLSLDDYKAKCFHLKSKNPCVSQGYINYLKIFYCKFGTFPQLGYCCMFLWLLVLFYLMGNTASEYFCSSLDSLSRLLKLSPTIAGVTLLSLGNGANDVFSSLVSFMGGGNGEIGLNTILGGASFVSCVVVGILSISMRKRRIRVNKSDFVRDICFYLLVIVCLGVILIRKEMDVWAAMAFSSLYIVYVIVVYVSHTRRKKCFELSCNSSNESDLTVPILSSIEEEDLSAAEEGAAQGSSEVVQVKKCCCNLISSAFFRTLIFILELPLYLPRRLTIPVVCEERWCKPYAVASVTLAPVLLSTLWNHQFGNVSFKTKLAIYIIGLVFGITFGIAAFLTTEKSSPPKKSLVPWLTAGFVMSITWSYLTAQELVGLLVSLGYILGVSPSILGLTVLAWGNSLGDLITNLTMALNGGTKGAQIAFSACYAGPIFNTLFGLGLSLVGSAWSKFPSPVLIQSDPYLLETVCFLAIGLLWALVVLPRRGMRLDGVLGGGLLVVYIGSMSLRLIQTLGSVKF